MQDRSYPYFFAGGWRAWLFIFGPKRLLKSGIFWFSFFASTLTLFAVRVLRANIYDVLVALIDVVLSVFPSLVGFTLAAYALVVASGNPVVFERLSLKKPGKRFSHYQISNSVWGFILLVNVSVLVIAFGLKVVNQIDLASEFYVSSGTAIWVNNIAFFVLTFFCFYSLLLHFRIVRLLFESGQKSFYTISQSRMSGKDKEEAITEL